MYDSQSPVHEQDFQLSYQSLFLHDFTVWFYQSPEICSVFSGHFKLTVYSIPCIFIFKMPVKILILLKLVIYIPATLSVYFTDRSGVYKPVRKQ
jgi:hypothetical protein